MCSAFQGCSEIVIDGEVNAAVTAMLLGITTRFTEKAVRIGVADTKRAVRRPLRVTSDTFLPGAFGFWPAVVDSVMWAVDQDASSAAYSQPTGHSVGRDGLRRGQIAAALTGPWQSAGCGHQWRAPAHRSSGKFHYRRSDLPRVATIEHPLC